MSRKRFLRTASIAIALGLIFGGLQSSFAKDNGKPASPGNSASAGNSSSSKNNSNSNSAQGNSSSTSGSSQGNESSNGNSGNSSKTETKVDAPAKSSNPRLSQNALAPSQTNIRATKASVVRSRTAPSCQAFTAKAKQALAADPCSDFIVVFQPGFARASSTELIKTTGAQVKQEWSNALNGALVNGPLSKMLALANNPNVLVVEDDLEVTSTAIQSPAPWGLDRIDQLALPLSNTFNDNDNSGLNTYSFVVDTGIDASNSDFGSRVVPGFTAIADGLGSKDCNGHGTHVAGIIGGSAYGVAKKTTLVPVRVLDCAGSGSYSSVISGLDWIAANFRVGDAAVVNMSLGGPASSTLDGAVRNLISKGITVVVAAGNSNADACSYSPSRVIDAITVGATDNSDTRAYYSNYGSCLDVFAPGSAITSTWLGAAGTNTISGTSMASPNVAGVIARFLGYNPGLTPAQVANSVKTSSTKGVVINPGTNSLNQLVYLEVKPNTTTVTPIDTSPTFKKTTPRGRK